MIQGRRCSSEKRGMEIGSRRRAAVVHFIRRASTPSCPVLRGICGSSFGDACGKWDHGVDAQREPLTRSVSSRGRSTEVLAAATT